MYVPTSQFMTAPPIIVNIQTASNSATASISATTSTATNEDWDKLQGDVKMAGYKPKTPRFDEEELTIIFDNNVGARAMITNSQDKNLQNLRQKLDGVLKESVDKSLNELNPQVKFLIDKVKKTVSNTPPGLHKKYLEQGAMPKEATTKVTRAYLLKTYVLPVCVIYLHTQKKPWSSLYDLNAPLFIPSDIVEQSLEGLMTKATTDRNIIWTWMSFSQTIIDIVRKKAGGIEDDAKKSVFYNHYGQFQKDLDGLAVHSSHSAEYSRANKENTREMNDVFAAVKIYIKSSERRELLTALVTLAEMIRTAKKEEKKVMISSTVFNCLVNFAITEIICTGTVRVGGIFNITWKQFYDFEPVFVDDSGYASKAVPGNACDHQKRATNCAEKAGITKDGNICCEDVVDPKYFLTLNSQDKGVGTKRAGWLVLPLRLYKLLQDSIVIRATFFEDSTTTPSKTSIFVNAAGNGVWSVALTVFNEVTDCGLLHNVIFILFFKYLFHLEAD